MNILKQIKIVLWAFLGVRSKDGKDDDIKSVNNPLIFLGIGLVLFLVFVIALIILVNIVTKVI